MKLHRSKCNWGKAITNLKIKINTDLTLIVFVIHAYN